MHIICSFTSDYFPIYDDEYEHVYYDDDDHHHHHVLHDIWGFADLQTSGYRQLTRLWWVQGCEPPGGLTLARVGRM